MPQLRRLYTFHQKKQKPKYYKAVSPIKYCGHKIIHDLTGAKIMKKRCEMLRRKPLRIYYHPKCKGYHLTHKEPLHRFNRSKKIT